MRPQLAGETFTVGQNQRQRVASLPPPGPQRSVGSMGRGVFTHRLNVISRDFNNIKTLDISQSLDEREREQWLYCETSILPIMQSPINPELIPSCYLKLPIAWQFAQISIHAVTVTEMVTQDGTEAISRPQPLFRNNFWVMTSFLDISIHLLTLALHSLLHNSCLF